MFYTLRAEGNPLAYADTIDWWMRRFLPLFTLALSALMVLCIPYPHVVNQVLSGQRSLEHVVAVLFSGVVILAFHGYSVPVVCSIFVLGPPPALRLAPPAESKPASKKQNRCFEKMQNLECKMRS